MLDFLRADRHVTSHRAAATVDSTALRDSSIAQYLATPFCVSTSVLSRANTVPIRHVDVLSSLSHGAFRKR
jgi:hypothetical protein